MIVQEKILSTREKVGKLVQERLGQFKNLSINGITSFSFYPFLDLEPYNADIFSESCFCILTANSSASLGIRIQKEIGIEGFREYPYNRLFEIIRGKGHRFASQRAERIVKLRDKTEVIEGVVSMKSGREARGILVREIEGYGYKEASHFLRNVGFEDIAIVDRHIYRFLVENSLVNERRTLTKKAYLECEDALINICQNMKLSMAELDLYIFYIKTGKVLK